MPAGRKSKLTPAVIKKVDKYLREGNYEIVVCQLSGMSQTSYYNWLNDAEEILEKLENEEITYNELTTHEKRLIKFLDTVREGKAYAESLAVKHIQKASLEEKHWQAAAWYLERKYPNRWGKREPGTGGGEDDENNPLDRFLEETEKAADEALQGEPTPEPDDDINETE